MVHKTRVVLDEAGSLECDFRHRMAIMTINRPHRKNALTQDMWVKLGQAMANLPGDLRLLILRGRQGFSAGSDLFEFARMSVDQANRAFELMEGVIGLVESVPYPTLAVIDGPAIGAGLMLALACDLRIGSSTAQLGMPVGTLGITLQEPFLRRLVRHLGPSRAKALIYLAQSYTAQEALNAGLLHAVADGADLRAAVIQAARRIVRQYPASLRAVKMGLNNLCGPSPNMADAGQWVDPQDFTKGVESFIRKRERDKRATSQRAERVGFISVHPDDSKSPAKRQTRATHR